MLLYKKLLFMTFGTTLLYSMYSLFSLQIIFVQEETRRIFFLIGTHQIPQLLYRTFTGPLFRYRVIRQDNFLLSTARSVVVVCPPGAPRSQPASARRQPRNHGNKMSPEVAAETTASSFLISGYPQHVFRQSL